MIGEMTWTLEERLGGEQVMEYEARVDVVLARHGEPAVCTYDITKRKRC
jgi:hypothetical protein